jgi:hypothetical protein
VNNRPPGDPGNKDKRGGHPTGDPGEGGSGGNGGGGNSPLSNPNAQRIWLFIGFIVILMFLFMFMGNGRQASSSISWNELTDAVRANKVDMITERGGSEIEIVFK